MMIRKLFSFSLICCLLTQYTQVHIEERWIPHAVASNAPVNSTALSLHMLQRECRPLRQMWRLM